MTNSPLQYLIGKQFPKETTFDKFIKKAKNKSLFNEGYIKLLEQEIKEYQSDISFYRSALFFTIFFFLLLFIIGFILRVL